MELLSETIGHHRMSTLKGICQQTADKLTIIMSAAAVAIMIAAAVATGPYQNQQVWTHLASIMITKFDLSAVQI